MDSARTLPWNSVVIIWRFIKLQWKNVRKFLYSSQGLDHSCILVLILAEIRLKLSEMEVWQGNLSGAVSALTEALSIEKSQ
jgi:hypothetical protein